LKIWKLSWLIAMVVFPTAWAEPATPLTLDQAIQTAITNNPQVKAAQARLGVSDAEIQTASALPNPTLLSDNGIAEKTYRLGVTQTLEMGGKRKQRVAVAHAQREVLQAEINTQLLELKTEVRRAYTQLYNAQERQRTYENILQVTQELVAIAQNREKAGDVSKLDVLQTDIMRVNANNDLQISAVEVLNARNRLNALLNQPLTTELALAPPNTVPTLAPTLAPVQPVPPTGPILQGGVSQLDADLDNLIAEALNRRPELQQNLRNIEVTRHQTALARANRIPDLTLAAGPDLVTEPGQKEVSVFIMGNLELPLFNRQQGPLLEAQARRMQLSQEQAALKNRITLEVTNAFTNFKANQARIHRYESELLPYSVAVVDKSRLAFQEGKTSILTPISAQQAYMKTRLGYLQALTDFQNNISDLERAVGAGL
jgi:cobalt-zinc-cadmium efflux system outer membrane protein